jgi:hypothetical protein
MRPTRPRRPRPRSRRRSRGARGESSPAGIVSRKRTGTRRPSVVTTTATSSRLSFDRSTLLLPVRRSAESRRRSCRCPPMPMVPVEWRTPSGRFEAPCGRFERESAPLRPLRAPSALDPSPGAPSAPDPSPRDMVSRPSGVGAGCAPPPGRFGLLRPLRRRIHLPEAWFRAGRASAPPKGARPAPSSAPGAAAMPRSNGVAGNSQVTAGDARSGLMCACPRDRPPHGDQPPHGDRPPRAAPPPPFASSATCAALSGWRSAGHEKTPG